MIKIKNIFNLSKGIILIVPIKNIHKCEENRYNICIKLNSKYIRKPYLSIEGFIYKKPKEYDFSPEILDKHPEYKFKKFEISEINALANNNNYLHFQINQTRKFKINIDRKFIKEKYIIYLKIDNLRRRDIVSVKYI